MDGKRQVRIWCIGSDGTEYYAAHDEAEMREFYIGMVGKSQAEEDFAACFKEVPDSQLDESFIYYDDEERMRTTWRELISQKMVIPTQIATGYN